MSELKGRKLDRAVAEQFIGLSVEGLSDDLIIVGESPWAWKLRETDEDRGGDAQWLPYLHRDMAAAWIIVERLYEDGWHVHLHLFYDEHLDGWNQATISRGAGLEFDFFGDTIPEAICLAGLKVAEVRATPTG